MGKYAIVSPFLKVSLRAYYPDYTVPYIWLTSIFLCQQSTFCSKTALVKSYLWPIDWYMFQVYIDTLLDLYHTPQIICGFVLWEESQFPWSSFHYDPIVTPQLQEERWNNIYLRSIHEFPHQIIFSQVIPCSYGILALWSCWCNTLLKKSPGS